MIKHTNKMGRGKRLKTATVTMKDVARLAGVSLGTVSKVFNNHKGVKPVNFGKVQAAVRQLNFKPNDVARSMRTKSSRMIGCMVTTVNNPVAGQMIQGAENILRQAGYALLLSANHHVEEDEATILNVFKARRAEGVILTVTRDQAPETKSRLRDLSIPTVLWERDSGPDFDAALTDHAYGAEVAASHLLALGHRRIAIIAGYQETWTGREQLRGYQAAFAAASVTIEDELISYTDSFDLGRIYALFQLAKPPTALIVNVHNAALALRAANKLGRSAPRDFSVVSIGDSEELEVFAPPITAVRGDGAAIGAAAARLILDRLSGSPPKESRRVVVPMELIIRNSTAPPSSKGILANSPHP
jgi:LacI family transcriptional regulator